MESVNWSKFRAWANLNWGISAEASFLSLGDGLWLFFCGSAAKVSQILALNRWLFGKIAIQLDRWIPDAGRSKVLFEEDAVWVWIRGIPLHLRSPDLFRQLGEACGSFLRYEECGSLSSVKILVKLKGVLPEEISICHGGYIFPVRVDPESVISSSGSVNPGSMSLSGLSKGKEVLSPSVPPPPSQISVPVMCSTAEPRPPASAPTDFPDFSDVPESSDVPRTLLSDRSLSTRCFDSASSEGTTSQFSVVSFSSAPSPSHQSFPSFVGLQLDEDDNLIFYRSSGLSSYSLVKECSGSPMKLQGSKFLLSWAGPSVGFPFKPFSPLKPTVLFSPNPAVFLQAPPAFSASDPLPPLAISVTSPLTTSVPPPSLLSVRDSAPFEESHPSLPSNDLETPQKPAVLQKLAVSHLAKVIGITDPFAAVEATSSDSSQTSLSSGSCSRTERELRKLGKNLASLEVGSRRSRRDKVCAPSPFPS
ncbi:hypothetical protein LINPERHAP2_LOCUS41369 [Linum perenne]